MDSAKRKKLERAGWKVGSASEFLGLSDQEAALVELKLALSATVRERRRGSNLSQVELARRLGSSQSRVAKLEAADPSVSLDLLIRSLLALGVTGPEIAAALGESAGVTSHQRARRITS
jgi:ribosome-binding protein aMBF1 (putative translation factor)